MAIEFSSLPFAQDALEPYMSARTLGIHHGKHHRKYVETLNQLIKGTAFEDCELEEIVLSTHGKSPKIFNNAAQAWNHTFFWNCLAAPGDEPSEAFKRHLAKDFGSFDKFQEEFSAQAKELFGSGWTWLVKEKDGSLKIKPLGNAENPMVNGQTPILACDVWEHAYYLDYQNERPKFLEAFWKIVNWDFVEARLKSDVSDFSRRPFHHAQLETPSSLQH